MTETQSLLILVRRNPYLGLFERAEGTLADFVTSMGAGNDLRQPNGQYVR